MKRIVFVDVDGTIYKSRHNSIDESVGEALHELSKYADIYLATGRCDAALAPIGDAIKYFKGLVLTNGALVYLNDKIIVDEVMKKEDVAELVTTAKELNMNIALISKDKVYVKEFNDIVNTALSPYKEDAVIDLHGYNFDLTQDYNMAWSFDYNEKILEFEERCDKFSIFDWGAIGADIIVKNVSKAHGIQELLKHLDKDIITYAIGDSNNDLEMFDLVDIPICMANGSDKAKAKAKHITESIHDAGFEKAVRRIIKGEW